MTSRARARRLWLCGYLLAASPSLWATESIDCSNDDYSVQVVCGSEDCFGFNFYIGSEHQAGSSWRLEKSLVDKRRRTIRLFARSVASGTGDIALKAKGEKGVLRMGKQSVAVNCDWSAFR